MKIRIKLTTLFLTAFTVALFASVGVMRAYAKPPLRLELISVKKVWDKAPHNAFTDLIRYKGKWFLTFREAASHRYKTPTGNIRVLTSKDGEKWESASLIEYGTDNDDLRDSKLSITPEGRLLLLCALSPKGNHKTIQSFAYLSDDGKTWEGPHEIGEPNWWIWRLAWSPDGMAYGVGYNCELKKNQKRITRLYRSKDGLRYETILPQFTPQDSASEAGLLFRKDGSAVVLVRRDPGGAVVGRAKSGDYRKWTFQELKQRIGGPQIIETPDARHILVVGRLYNGKRRTSVGLLDPEAGTFTELLKLPATENSGGDTSYPGMVFHDGLLWISYYSYHAGKTRIYLAKVKVHNK